MSLIPAILANSMSYIIQRAIYRRLESNLDCLTISVRLTLITYKTLFNLNQILLFCAYCNYDMLFKFYHIQNRVSR